MKAKKLRLTMVSGLVALSMMALPMTTGAAERALADAAPSIEKTVNVAKGVTIDQDVSFRIEQVANPTHEDGTVIIAPSTIEAFTVTAATANGTSDGGSVVKTAETGLGDKDLKPGEYTFKVTEVTDPLTVKDGYGWIANDTNDFFIHVYVSADGTKKYSATAKNVITDSKADLKFTNTYTKRGNENNSGASLTLTKAVENKEYVDNNTTYKFTITFTASSTDPDQKTAFASTIDGKDNGTVKSGDTIELKDGETLSFPDIPAGATVTVEEAQTTNQESVRTVAVSNGSKPEEVTGNYKVENLLIGEEANSITYTNTYKSITPTGIVTSIAPFAAMIAAAALAAALYFGLKKRMTR